MRRLRRWMELTWRERGALVRAVVYLAMAKFHRKSPLPASGKRVRERSRVSSSPYLLAWAVAAAARNVPFATTCLDRALTLFRLMQAAGLEATLRIGVRTDEGELAAHAWVEHGGVVLLDEEASRFVAFDAPILTSK